jgi:hypothetical protein
MQTVYPVHPTWDKGLIGSLITRPSAAMAAETDCCSCRHAVLRQTLRRGLACGANLNARVRGDRCRK